MNPIRYLIASAALTCSANAQAANFVEYTFTGKGLLVAGISESYPPEVAFTSVFFADLDANEQCLLDQGVCYSSNGTDSYNSHSFVTLETTGVRLSGNSLAATNAIDYLTSSSTSISADFDSAISTFASLSGSGFTGGKFTYKYQDHTGGLLVYGDLTGFSVRKVDGPGALVSSYTAVPEASTWTMMLAGFGMIGFAARRRQIVKATVQFA